MRSSEFKKNILCYQPHYPYTYKCTNIKLLGGGGERWTSFTNVDNIFMVKSWQVLLFSIALRLKDSVGLIARPPPTTEYVRRKLV